MWLIYRRSPTGAYQVHALHARCEAIGVRASRREASWRAVRRCFETATARGR